MKVVTGGGVAMTMLAMWPHETTKPILTITTRDGRTYLTLDGIEGLVMVPENVTMSVRLQPGPSPSWVLQSTVLQIPAE